VGEGASALASRLRRQEDLTGVVLCGGKSLRMGRDKASLALAGATLLERAAAELERISTETLLACGPEPKYAELGRPLVLDGFGDGGPLAGLEAALSRSGTDWLAAIACDMPRADARVHLALLERAREGEFDACLLETPQGVEPLCAVYRRTCLDPVRAALRAGERKMTSFHRFRTSSGALPRIGLLPERELPGDLAGATVALNLNTPAELAAEARGGSS